MNDNQTLQVYADKAGDYARMADGVAEKDPAIAAFVAAVTPGGHVLDLGCGPGHYAALLAQSGLRVTAFDPVPEMVERAAVHRGVTVKQAGFDDVQATDEYHGIWANFSLLHAPRNDMPRYLKALYRALKSEGKLHIGLKTGAGSYRDTIGRLYTYYTEDELMDLLNQAGFTVLQVTHGEDAGLSGEVAPWICVLSHA